VACISCPQCRGRSARRTDPGAPFGLGSEVAIRAGALGPEEQLFEVDRFIPGHQLSLVGAFSIRRRIDVRIESKTERSKIVVRVDYPTYGGVLGALIDRLTDRAHIITAGTDSYRFRRTSAQRESGKLP